MKKLNPITAAYLWLLELVSVVLIALGEKLDPLFAARTLTPEEWRRRTLHEKQWRDDDDSPCSTQTTRFDDDFESVRSSFPAYSFDPSDPCSPYYGSDDSGGFSSDSTTTGYDSGSWDPFNS